MKANDAPSTAHRSTFAPVTVVIPCYRNAATIRRAVLSAIDQSWPPREVIVVDDASDDRATGAALSELKSEFHRRGLTVLEIKENCGPANARNVGWEAGTQPLIAFLDADDAWQNRKLELQIPLMLAPDAPAISGHDVRVGDIYESEVPDSPVRAGMVRLTPQQLLLRNWYATSSVVLRATVPHRFDTTRRHCEDYDLWLRIALSGHLCIFLPVPLAQYFKSFFGASGLSGQLWRMELAQGSVYSALLAERLISPVEYITLRTWGSLRFVRRLVLSAFLRRNARFSA